MINFNKFNLKEMKKRVIIPLFFLYTAISVLIYIIVEIATFCYRIVHEDYQPTLVAITIWLSCFIILGYLIRYIYKSIRHKAWNADNTNNN